MLRKVVAWTLLITVSWTTYAFASPPAQSTENPDQLTYEQAIERLDQFMKLIEELRSHIDRSQFDLDALLEKLDYDPDKIIDFVKNDIAFEQYPGLLRGAKGTLMSRAGNALDQSVLLATLLKDAGADARIARGKLSTEDAHRLLDRMFLPRPPQPAIGDLDAMEHLLAVTRRSAGLPGVSEETPTSDLFSEAETQERNLYAIARKTTRDFRSRLKAAGVALGDPAMATKLTTEAQDYFWVEYRLAASGPWKSVHPAFGDQQNPSVQRIATLKETIPGELQQRVRFDVEIEQQIAGRLTRKKVMSDWERPVANLIGLQMRFMAVPDGLKDLSDLVNPDDVARVTTFFAPTFNGKLAPGAQLFDLDGVTLPPDAAGSPAAGIFKQTGEKTEAATGALSALGAKPAAGGGQHEVRSLTGAWLLYTLKAPGRPDRTIRRALFDPVGAANRKGDRLVGTVGKLNRDEATWSLARQITFMASPCDYPGAYQLDRTLDQMLQLRPLLEVALDVRYGEAKDGAMNKVLKSFRTTPEFAHFPTVAAGIPRSTDLISYEAAPSIVSTWNGIERRQQGIATQSKVDVISQGRRTLRRGPTGPESATQEAILTGVWETEAEQLVVSATLPPDGGHIGAPRMLEEARERGVQLLVIPPRNRSAVKGISVPAVMKSSIESALRDGYAVITPKEDPPGMTLGWWRVDPSTGDTLGMGPAGLGVEGLEKVILQTLISLVITVAISTVKYTVCIGAGCEKKQCTEEFTNSVLKGLLIGAVFGLAVGVVAEEAEAAYLTFEYAANAKLGKAFVILHELIEMYEKGHHAYETGENISITVQAVHGDYECEGGE